MKMFAKFVPFLLVAAMSVFTACGGDSGSNADSEEPVSSSAVKKSSSSKANSSSSKKGSSSSVKSSSSSKTPSSANSAKAIYDEKNNTMKDPRDNKTYKTVKIGDQVWMAENLNYNSCFSYCYGEEPSNMQNSNPGLCNKYGRLYKWEAATEACPGGWHLPSKDEFETLIQTVGGSDNAGIKLKSVDGWKFEKKETVGTDEYGFTALPGGYRMEYDFSGYVSQNVKSYDFIGDKTAAYFWSSTEDIESSTRLDRNSILVDHAFSMFLDNRYASADIGGEPMDNALSVRCILDSKTSSDTKSSSSKKAESSSSVKSSSSAKSGSSVAVPKGCKTSTEDNCEYGELVDDRDGQTYKTVKIGDQWWMAQNLNYRREAKYKNDYCYCYNNSKDNCDKFGRLYVWDAAADACPKGWHLPSTAEWKTLIDSVGGEKVAGITLKTSDWISSGEATDAFGFSVLPAGFRDWVSNYYWEEGYQAFFWTSDEYENSSGCVYFQGQYDNADIRSRDADYGYSVRCVMDVEPKPSVTEPTAKACKTETKDECEYGSLTDSRDKQTYKTVKIDKQWWMAENLNFDAEGSHCFNNDPSKCAKHGRFYFWSAAMDSVGEWSSNGKDCGMGNICTPTYPVRGVCPEGWHLPTSEEYEILFAAVGGELMGGKVLKSTSGWYDNDDDAKPGTDDYAFSVLPTESRYDTEDDLWTYIWTSTGLYESAATTIIFVYDRDDVLMTDMVKDFAYPVRCVKD